MPALLQSKKLKDIGLSNWARLCVEISLFFLTFGLNRVICVVCVCQGYINFKEDKYTIM